MKRLNLAVKLKDIQVLSKIYGTIPISPVIIYVLGVYEK